MKTANCPSCGAGIIFKSAVSVLAVCEYCRSTLIRHDLDLENLGRMAELLPDSSPIQLLARGSYHGMPFTVVGRIQLRYPQGLWNEWYLLFDNQRGGWLGETQGSYVLTFRVQPSEPVPSFAELRAGQPLQLKGRLYEVSNLESALCVGGEGELPLRIGAGYVAPVVDLQGIGVPNAFATLDYSEEPPLVFMGERLGLQDLQFTGLRDLNSPYQGPGTLPGQPPPLKPSVRTFRCPGCGTSLEIRAQGSEALACGSCGSVIDLHNENYQILSRYNARVKHRPLIPLGNRGVLFKVEYQVVGYLRRKVRVEGVDYEWCEYLLFNAEQGFCWLVEYHGHWTFSITTRYVPKRLGSAEQPKVYYQGRTYRHFQTAAAEVSYVLGEFYWRVRVGETATVADYVDPPFMLSCEQTVKEIVWSVAEYVEPQLVGDAFKPPKPMPLKIGVAPSQPYPEAGQVRRIVRVLGIFLTVLILLQGGFLVAAQNQRVYQQDFLFDPGAKDKTFTTDVFELGGRPSNVLIKSRGNLDNTWLYLELDLIDQDTGTAYRFGREISYYQGLEDNERWSEGSQTDEAVLAHIPAGHYYLSIEAETPASSVAYSLEVYRDVPGWSNFLIALAALIALPVFSLWKRHSFENARWSESDHPPSSDGDGD